MDYLGPSRLPPGADAVQMIVPVERMIAEQEPMRVQAIFPIEGDLSRDSRVLGAEYFARRAPRLDDALMLNSRYGPRREIFPTAESNGRDSGPWVASLDGPEEQVMVLRGRQHGQERWAIGVQSNGGEAARQALMSLPRGAESGDVTRSGTDYQHALAKARAKNRRLAADAADALGVRIAVREDTKQTQAGAGEEGYYQVHFLAVPATETISAVLHRRHGTMGGPGSQQGQDGSVYVETSTQHIDKALGAMIVTRDPLSGWSTVSKDISLRHNPHRIFPSTLQGAVDAHDLSSGVIPAPPGARNNRHPNDVRRLGILTPATPSEGYPYYPRVTDRLETELDHHSGGAWRKRTDWDTVLLKTGVPKEQPAGAQGPAAAAAAAAATKSGSV